MKPPPPSVAQIRAALFKRITPEWIEECIAALPEKSRKQFVEPPVRRIVRITRREKP